MTMAARVPVRQQGQMPLTVTYQDSSKQLWSEIWNTLMGYIDAEDSPEKLDQKEALVDLMSVFLSRVSHDSKFYLAATAAVLRTTAERQTFRPLQAAEAFEALHEYAVRILAQPWRSEFTSINMYSGYYVHTVQSRLVDAHRLLQEMGFRVDAAAQRATLAQPVDVDQVTKAAIDTLMASVECRMIEHILSSLPAGAFSGRGVLSYRMAYVGGVEAAVRHLTVTLRQKNFQQYFSPPGEVPPQQQQSWQPQLPAVPTARLVDISGETAPRDAVDSGPSHMWIPRTIRHQPRPADEPRPADQPQQQQVPPAAALLPATLQQHQQASWEAVSRAPPRHTQPQQHPASLDDSWGYVLNSLQRQRPASRYDNVAELDINGVPPVVGAGHRTVTPQNHHPPQQPQLQLQQQRSAGTADQRNPFDARSHVSSYQNGTVSARADGWGAAPVRAETTLRARQSPGGGSEMARAPELAAWPRAADPGPRQPATPPRHEPSHDSTTVVNSDSVSPRRETTPTHTRPARPAPSQAEAVADDRGGELSNPAFPAGGGAFAPVCTDHAKSCTPSFRVASNGTGSRAMANGTGGQSDPLNPSPGRASGSPPAGRAATSQASAPAGRAATSQPSASVGRTATSQPSASACRAATSQPSAPEDPPSAAASAAGEQWSCHACTYLNPVLVRVCGMCGKSRPQQTGRVVAAEPQLVPEEADDRACPQCTLFNSRRARKCGACDAPLK